MGVARLLAKGWVVFCLFAAAHAFNLALSRGELPLDALQSIVVCVLLFGAMGMLFIAGFGMSAGLGGLTWRSVSGRIIFCRDLMRSSSSSSSSSAL